MKVYVLTGEYYHEGSELIGVYASWEAARIAKPGPWQAATKAGGRTVARQLMQPENWDNTDTWDITEMEVQGLGDSFPDDPVKSIALAALEGDPVAMDAVRDIVRG